MRETIKRWTYWEFSYKKIDMKNKISLNALKQKDIIVICETKKFVQIKLKPQETFTKLVQILNQLDLCKIKDVSSFAKIARGQRCCYYGWQLIAIEIDWEFI